jgi:hypothetical protein
MRRDQKRGLMLNGNWREEITSEKTLLMKKDKAMKKQI